MRVVSIILVCLPGLVFTALLLRRCMRLFHQHALSHAGSQMKLTRKQILQLLLLGIVMLLAIAAVAIVNTVGMSTVGEPTVFGLVALAAACLIAVLASQRSSGGRY